MAQSLQIQEKQGLTYITHNQPKIIHSLRIVKWKPLDRSCYKTNFDGAIFANSGEAGFGVVIRNSQGQVLASLSEKIPNPYSIAALELLAARRAISFIKEVGLDNSILEGDSESCNKPTLIF